MADILLTWNKKDLSDLHIVTGDDGLPMIFDSFVDAKDYGDEMFMNYERVTIGD